MRGRTGCHCGSSSRIDSEGGGKVGFAQTSTVGRQVVSWEAGMTDRVVGTAVRAIGIHTRLHKVGRGVETVASWEAGLGQTRAVDEEVVRWNAGDADRIIGSAVGAVRINARFHQIRGSVQPIPDREVWHGQAASIDEQVVGCNASYTYGVVRFAVRAVGIQTAHNKTRGSIQAVSNWKVGRRYAASVRVEVVSRLASDAYRVVRSAVRAIGIHAWNDKIGRGVETVADWEVWHCQTSAVDEEVVRGDASGANSLID